MKLANLFQKFDELRTSVTEFVDAYKVVPVSKNNGHKLGCSENGFPVFFIECSDAPNVANIHLRIIDALFNQRCNLSVNNKLIADKKYCMVVMKDSEDDLIKYFLDVISLVLEKLPKQPTTKQLAVELAKITQLFTNMSAVDAETIQGLWAEMLVIEQSHNPDYLIKSWHNSPIDKYDFNDGSDKIEVKSTIKQIRTHKFAIEQLNPNQGSRLVVASIQMTKTGTGCSLFDLEEKIMSKISDRDSAIRLKEIIVSTIGAHLSEIGSVFYDYAQAVDSLKFYDYKVVPSISLDCIPQGVSNVHFSVDFSNVVDVDRDSMNGLLHRSL